MLQAVAVATERDTLLNLFFYSLPAVTMVHHVRYVVILVANMVELQDSMIIYPTLLALQSLLVLQELLSIALQLLFGAGH